MRFAWCLLLAACQGPSIVTLGSEPLAVPEVVDFGQTAVSFSRVREVLVTNRGRAPKSVEVQALAPFFAPAQLEVPGGSDVVLEVRFSPALAGAVTGTLLIDGQEVLLTGEGVAPLDCGAPSVCEGARFDPDTLSCVREPRPDGAPCEDELQCLEAGSCQAGRCVGQAARCDDANPCTTDACAVGVGCQHAARECQAPANPCQAAVCDPLTGCGSVPVQDGTPCGAVSCALANVCLAGACRAVVPPDGFTCAPASACRGEGVCRNKACVQPAEQELLPRWRYTSTEAELRFEGVNDAQGNWYWVECGYEQLPAAFRCVAVSTTSDGLERFRTAVISTTYQGTGGAHTQLLAGDRFVFVVDQTVLAAVDVNTGALAWQRTLVAKAPGAWHWVNELAEDGRGVVWATVRAQGPERRTLLLRLELATGVTRAETLLEGTTQGLVLDALGRAYTARAVPPTNGRSFFESYEASGVRRFSVMQSSPRPVSISGDLVVMADDTTRSTLDGSERFGADPQAQTSQWVGVAQPGGTRFRLGRSLTDLGPPMLISRVEPGGARSQLAGLSSDQASELFLTAAGDVLLATASSTETRAQQLDARGNVVMSCALTDDTSGTARRMDLGTVAGFNGRYFAARPQSWGDCCELCDIAEFDADHFNGDCAFIARRDLLFYELGRPGPGVAASGWVGPRGTPGGGQRAR